jgi:hypothetical protein
MEEPLKAPPLTPDEIANADILGAMLPEGLQLHWAKAVRAGDGWEVTYNFGPFDEWHALE